MQNKLLLIFFIVLFGFIFFIFFKSLDKESTYSPNKIIKKDIPVFVSKIFNSNRNFTSKEVFNKDEYYLLNIWASWCIPCKEEHHLIMNLSKIKKINVIGLNYKDNMGNAKKFLKDLGNPYEKILIDHNGTLAIEWGAYGVPESFFIFKDKILKRYIGPLNKENVNEILSFTK